MTKQKPLRGNCGGFALVITLSLLVLLALIAVGLLTLTDQEMEDRNTARTCPMGRRDGTACASSTGADK